MKKPTTRHYADLIPSPLGAIWALVNEEGALVKLDFEGGRSAPRNARALERDYAARGVEVVWSKSRLKHVAAALKRYFSGKARRFELDVAPEGSPFQQRVWKELVKIPFGETVSYGELARRVGRPAAARAVGRANATNPVSLVVPCHRVIGTNGKLTGYGGGMDRKQALLELEGALVPGP